MRGAIEGLPMPYPIETLLPAVLREDDFTRRLTAGLDEVLAPAVSTLDCLDAYLSPALAPDDFLGWLSSWFSEAADDSWPADRRRRFVAHAAELFRGRGTVAGLRRELELCTGGRVEVSDSGGVGWSHKPEARLPGEPVPRLTIRVESDADHGWLESIIKAAKPAHVPHRLEVAVP
jgi:phage tail-like protein